jgi:hypothetical protein
VRFPTQPGQYGRERVLPVKLDVAVGDDEKKR